MFACKNQPYTMSFYIIDCLTCVCVCVCVFQVFILTPIIQGDHVYVSIYTLVYVYVLLQKTLFNLWTWDWLVWLCLVRIIYQHQFPLVTELKCLE